MGADHPRHRPYIPSSGAVSSVGEPLRAHVVLCSGGAWDGGRGDRSTVSVVDRSGCRGVGDAVERRPFGRRWCAARDALLLGGLGPLWSMAGFAWRIRRRWSCVSRCIIRQKSGGRAVTALTVLLRASTVRAAFEPCSARGFFDIHRPVRGVQEISGCSCQRSRVLEVASTRDGDEWNGRLSE